MKRVIFLCFFLLPYLFYAQHTDSPIVLLSVTVQDQTDLCYEGFTKELDAKKLRKKEQSLRFHLSYGKKNISGSAEISKKMRVRSVAIDQDSDKIKALLKDILRIAVITPFYLVENSSLKDGFFCERVGSTWKFVSLSGYKKIGLDESESLSLEIILDDDRVMRSVKTTLLTSDPERNSFEMTTHLQRKGNELLVQHIKGFIYGAAEDDKGEMNTDLSVDLTFLSD